MLVNTHFAQNFVGAILRVQKSRDPWKSVRRTEKANETVDLHSWHIQSQQMVAEYRCMPLTYPSDIFPVLLGLAKKVCGVHGNSIASL